ncbi:MAG: hypothetical protein ABI892_09065 [Flavobacterium sp.]
MQLPSELSNEILKILSQNHTKTYSLEELTTNVFNSSSKSQERENQARVLDALILLESEESISLNSFTDESQINITKYLKIM